MVKELSKYDRRIEDALIADDKRIKAEAAAAKALEDAKKIQKPPDDRNIVRSEQPVWVEDEKQANYMHDNRNEDGYLRPYLAWRYMLRQLGVSGTDIIADPWPNDVDNERAYPLLNCERHGHDIWMHQAQPNVTPQLPSTVTPGHLNFMYSKMVRSSTLPLHNNCTLLHSYQLSDREEWSQIVQILPHSFVCSCDSVTVITIIQEVHFERFFYDFIKLIQMTNRVISLCFAGSYIEKRSSYCETKISYLVRGIVESSRQSCPVYSSWYELSPKLPHFRLTFSFLCVQDSHSIHTSTLSSQIWEVTYSN